MEELHPAFFSSTVTVYFFTFTQNWKYRFFVQYLAFYTSAPIMASDNKNDEFETLMEKIREDFAQNPLIEEEFSLLHRFIGIYHRKLLYLLYNSGYFIPKRI